MSSSSGVDVKVALEMKGGARARRWSTKIAKGGMYRANELENWNRRAGTVELLTPKCDVRVQTRHKAMKVRKGAINPPQQITPSQHMCLPAHILRSLIDNPPMPSKLNTTTQNVCIWSWRGSLRACRMQICMLSRALMIRKISWGRRDGRWW